MRDRLTAPHGAWSQSRMGCAPTGLGRVVAVPHGMRSYRIGALTGS